MRLYLDSSALAKRYIQEAGTDRVLEQCAQANIILLSILCVPELISALNRLRRERKLTTPQYRRLKQDVAADVETASILDLNENVLQRAILCLERTASRAADALHIAAAQEANCDLFCTSDQRQADAAEHMGLKTDYIA